MLGDTRRVLAAPGFGVAPSEVEQLFAVGRHGQAPYSGAGDGPTAAEGVCPGLRPVVGSPWEGAAAAHEGRHMAEDTAGIAKQALEHLNAHDLDAYAALFADDCELTDTATGEVFHGPDGARRNMEGWFTPFPDAKIEIVNLVAGEGWAAIEAVGRGTQTGPMEGPGGEIPPTGKVLALPFCSTLQVSDGKIVGGRDYYNIADLMQQLGLMPEIATATA